MLVGSRVYIKLIELEGFKSYKKRHKIPLQEGLNVITGANGSGKSNILDALCFVFGYDSRMLRGTNAKSLISKGSTHACVTIYICNLSENHGSSIRRLISKSGTYQYKISHFTDWTNLESIVFKNASKSEVLTYLNSIGIDISFPERFIILQHHTTSLTQKTPLELMNHLEELFGTSHMKQDLLNCEKLVSEKMDTLKDKMDEAKFLYSEHQKLKPLSDKLKEFEILQKNLDDKSKKYQTAIFIKNKRATLQCKKELEKLLNQKKYLKEEKINLNSRIQDYEKDLAYLSKERSQYEMNLRSSINNRGKLEEKLARIKARLKYMDELEIESQKEIEQCLSKKEILKEKVSLCEKEIEAAEKVIPTLKEVVNSRLNCVVSYFDNLDHAQRVISRYIDFVDLFSENKSGKLKELQLEKDNLVASLEDIDNEAATLQKQLDSINKNIISLQNSEKGISSTIQSTHKELENLDIKSTHAQVSSKESRMREIVKQFKQGVHGLLIDIISIDKVSLGKILPALQSYLYDIVVESYEDALDVLQFTQTQRYGKVQCHILNSANDSHQIRDCEGCVPVLSFITTASKYKRLLSTLLRKWYHCEDEEDAKNISWKCRVNVISNGIIFYSNGDILLPKPNVSQNMDIIGRNDERPSLTNISKKKKDIEQELKDLKLQWNNAVKHLEESYLDQKNISQHLKQLRKRKVVIENQIENLKVLISDAEYSVNSSIDEHSDIKIKIKSIKQKVCETDFQNCLNAIQLYNEKVSQQSEIKSLLEDTKFKLEEICRNVEKKRMTIEKLENDKIEVIIEEKRVNIELKAAFESIEDIENMLKCEKVKKKDITSKLKKEWKEYSKLNFELEEISSRISKLKKDIGNFQAKKFNIDEKFRNEFSKFSQVEIENILIELQNEMAEIQSHHDFLQSRIDFESTAKLNRIETSIREVENARNACKLEIDQIYQQIRLLQEKRYNQFALECSKINQQLSIFMRHMTSNMSSDCHLQIIEQNVACFEAGVNIMSKHEGGEWKSMTMLSGGQQATVACALSLSLQKLYPCHLLICDEIDASLDTHRTENLSRVLRELKDRQVIIISLRPQIYDNSTNIVGVYNFQNYSLSIPILDTEIRELCHKN